MKGIADFLAKFKVIPNPRDEKKVIAEIVSGVIGQTVEEDSIEVQKTSIFLDIHPALKNLIFQKKEEILQKLNDRFKEKGFRNIV